MQVTGPSSGFSATPTIADILANTEQPLSKVPCFKSMILICLAGKYGQLLSMQDYLLINNAQRA